MPEKVHPQIIRARTELLVQLRRHCHGAQMWILATDYREHLQTVHLRHPQIANPQLEWLSLQGGNHARSGGSGLYLGPAWQLSQHVPVQIEQIRIVVCEQNLRARIHFFERPPLTRYRRELTPETPHVVLPVQ